MNRNTESFPQIRTYGAKPYTVALLHGGPGAAGAMAPIARELADDFGVLEPMQTKNSIDGQIEELRESLIKYIMYPITLIGWSWGAWLGWIFAARHPEQVKKIILVGSGPFKADYAKTIMPTRLDRLDRADRQDVKILEKSLADPHSKNQNLNLSRLGTIIEKADTFEEISHPEEQLDINMDIHSNVWSEAAKLRETGELLSMAKNVTCDVVAIHGDYDPHPAEGVSEPLMKALSDFRFILLEKCGHTPWIEKYAYEDFYAHLRRELD